MCCALPMSPCCGLSNETEVIPLCLDSQSSPVSSTAVTPWQHLHTFERYSWKDFFSDVLKIKSCLLRASYYYILCSIINLLFTFTPVQIGNCADTVCAKFVWGVSILLSIPFHSALCHSSALNKKWITANGHSLWLRHDIIAFMAHPVRDCVGEKAP